MLIYLLEKEFKQFLRNSFLPKFALIIPFMATLVFPMVANFDVKNIQLIVIDHDKNILSTQLVEKIKASGYFKLIGFAQNDKRAIKLLEAENRDIILEIPRGFSKNLKSDQPVQILMAVNAVNGTRGALGSQYLSSILTEFSQNINSSSITENRLRIIPGFWYNASLSYPVFMAPAIMIMVLSMICGFLPALNIVGEKQKGTMEQINVTPIKRGTFILSKLIPYWIIGFVILNVCMLVAWIAYGLVPQGSIGTLYLFTSVFVLAYSGFGLVISNYAKTVQQAMFMMFFFVMTFVFMSGLYTPVENMPEWAQLFSDISPLKYVMRAMRAIYLKDSGFTDLIPEFIALSILALLFNVWAILSYQKKIS